jgi:hypothetical protein
MTSGFCALIFARQLSYAQRRLSQPPRERGSFWGGFSP